MAISGFVLMELPAVGRRKIVADFATPEGAEEARRLYVAAYPYTNFTVRPASEVARHISACGVLA